MAYLIVEDFDKIFSDRKRFYFFLIIDIKKIKFVIINIRTFNDYNVYKRK